jgi:phosphoenolpyruvate-protein kinase (PTS system EI component)
MTPRAIPEAKQIIRSLTLAEAQEIAQQTLSLATVGEVHAYLDSVLEQFESPQAD